MADDGDKVAVTACLDADDTEAVLGILVSDPLDETGEHLSVCGFRMNRHDERLGFPRRSVTRYSDVRLVSRRVYPPVSSADLIVVALSAACSEVRAG
jgi:hypothetical protein